MLAIVLSLLVLLGWSVLFPKPQIVGKQEVRTISPPLSAAVSSIVPAALPSPVAMVETEPIKETIRFIQKNREIVFNPTNASIIEILFKEGKDHQLPLKAGLLMNNEIAFKLQSRTEESITFIAEDKNQRIIKKFYIPKDSYYIELETIIYNLTNSIVTLTPQLVLGRMDLSTKNPQARYQDIFLGTNEKSIHLSPGKNFSRGNIQFLGLRDQYFCTIIEPDKIITEAYIKKITPHESEVGLIYPSFSVQANGQIGHLSRIYLGPQDLKVINKINPEWSGIIYFGTFDFIAQILMQLLLFFFNLVHNWGVAIIILSMAVYFLLFPLSMKQMRSMKEMQLVQPKVEALRKEYKDNPQKLNKEIMELYRQHKVNPLGGCLPLLLQMPIFFALYQALMRSSALRGAHFLWIKDLSAPDQAFVLKNSIPFIGNQINILPILMAIGMFIQQKVASPQATGEAAQQQKMMAIIMPIMFGVIFYQMPSGLVLYWFVNSILMLIYQARIHRKT